jgi:hypothetical protein
MDRDEIALRATIRGYVHRWHLAMTLQAERTLSAATNDNREVDSHLFAVALKDLRTAVEWGGNKCRGDGVGALRKALADFDEAVPDAQNVRDVHEHFVNYESNDPKRFLKHIDQNFAVYWSMDETGNVEVSVAGYNSTLARPPRRRTRWRRRRWRHSWTDRPAVFLHTGRPAFRIRR